MLKIQKGVPIPPVDRTQKAGRRKWPFELMERGDFVFEAGGNIDSLSAYISRATKDLKGTWESRRCWMLNTGTPEDPVWALADPDTSGAEEGVGVWRTA